MADETKTLILDLQFNTEEGIQNAAKLRIAIEEDKKALAALNKTIKDNGEITLEQAEEREKLEKMIKDANKERATELKMVDNYLKATQGVTNANGEYNGSIKQMRANLGFLTEKWNNLTKEERENANIGGKLQKEIKGTSDELKKLEGSVGDTRRNVGNYSEAITNAISGNSNFTDGIAQVKAGFEGMKEAVSSLKGGFKDIGGAAGTAQKASIGLGLSFKAMGIGLLISLIAGAVSYLSKFDEGMDKVEQATKGVSAALDVFVKGLAPIGKLVTDMFTSPIETVKKLVKGTDEYNVELAELTANSVKAGIATAELTKRFQELEDSEDALLVKRAEADNQVRLALIATKDKNKTEAQKLALLDAAGKKEAEVSKQELENAEKKLRATREDIANKAGVANAVKMTDAQLIKLIESEKVQDAGRKEAGAAYIDLLKKQGESDETLQRIQNRRSAFELEQEAKRKKAAEDRLKEALKAEEILNRELKAASEVRVLQAGEGTRKELEARINAINIARDLELKTVGLTESEKVLIREKANKASLALMKDFTQKALEEEQKRLNLNLTVQEGFLKALHEQHEKELKDWDEKEKKKTDTAKAETDERIRIQEAEFQTASDISSGISSLISTVAGQSAEAVEFQKTIAVFQIGLDAARSLSQIVTLATAPSPDNIATGGLAVPFKIIGLSASVLANIAAAKQLISGDTPSAPKFAEGGILSGPSHAAGGIQGTGSFAGIEVEGGEAILTRNATAMFAPMLSLMNQIGGGKPLGNTRYAAAGGYLNQTLPATTRNFINNTGQGIDYNQLANAMSNIPAPVLSIKTFEQKVAQRNVTIKQASIGR